MFYHLTFFERFQQGLVADYWHLINVNATSVIRLQPMVKQSMWKRSQLLRKCVVWITGVRKLGNTWLGELAVIWLNNCWKRRKKSQINHLAFISFQTSLSVLCSVTITACNSYHVRWHNGKVLQRIGASKSWYHRKWRHNQRHIWNTGKFFIYRHGLILKLTYRRLKWLIYIYIQKHIDVNRFLFINTVTTWIQKEFRKV